MDATVAVAALGFVSTLLAAWLTARWQTRGLVETELVTARVAAYGDCAEALYELERVSFNRGPPQGGLQRGGRRCAGAGGLRDELQGARGDRPAGDPQ